MLELTIKNGAAIFGGLAFTVWIVATYMFNRFSVKYIDSELAKQGIFPPLKDNDVNYSFVLVFPNLISLVCDYKAVRKHARTIDKNLAMLLTVSMIITFTMIPVVYFLFIHNGVSA